jgi:hypothetical protein
MWKCSQNGPNDFATFFLVILKNGIKMVTSTKGPVWWCRPFAEYSENNLILFDGLHFLVNFGEIVQFRLSGV